MDGGRAENAGAIFGQPPWMAGVPKMQEQFSANRHGWRACRKCRSNFRPTAMDGARAANAGAIGGQH
jgi:hypothetical protein